MRWFLPDAKISKTCFNVTNTNIRKTNHLSTLLHDMKCFKTVEVKCGVKTTNVTNFLLDCMSHKGHVTSQTGLIMRTALIGDTPRCHPVCRCKIHLPANERVISSQACYSVWLFISRTWRLASVCLVCAWIGDNFRG